MKGHYKVINIQPFNHPVNIVVCKDVWDGVKYANKYHKHKTPIEQEEKDKGCLGTYYDYEKDTFIFLGFKADVDTVVHECFHTLMRLSFDRGAVWTKKSDEMFAYAMGNFTKEVMDFFYSIEEVNKILNENKN